MNWISSKESNLIFTPLHDKFINPYYRAPKRGRPSKYDLELRKKAYKWNWII